MDYLDEMMNEALYPFWTRDQLFEDHKESYNEYCNGEVESALCIQMEINNHE